MQNYKAIGLWRQDRIGTSWSYLRWSSTNKIPPRTLVVINIHIDLMSIHEDFICDVQSSWTHINAYPNIFLIPTNYQVDKACATEVSCVLINLYIGDIHITKVKMVRFLIDIYHRYRVGLNQKSDSVWYS